MASVATTFKRLFLRNLLWSAQDSGKSLYDVLKTAAQARLSETERGKFLVSTAANGHSAEWEVPRDLSPQSIVELLSQLLDRYDEAKAYLIAEGTASPTDQQIHDEMLEKLKAVRSYRHDFTNGRVQPCEVDE